MKKLVILFAFILALVTVLAASVPVFADDAAPAEAAQEQTDEEESASDPTSSKAFAAAALVAIVAAAGAIGMSIAISKSVSSMARQPEAASRINSAMMLGLVFIETAVIYALIVAILVIFVL